MATPVIAPLPIAPTRGDGPDDYMVEADAFTAALTPFSIQVNTAVSWMGDTMSATLVYKNAAATSAQAAADYATSANEAIGPSQAARDASIAARDQSQVYASAAQAAAGLPALAGNKNKVLTVKVDESGVAWKNVGQQIGDIIYTAAPAGAEYKLADGSIYLQSAYPDWVTKVGQPTVSSPTTSATLPSVPPTTIGPGSVAWGGNYLFLAGNTNASGTDPVIYVYRRTGQVFDKLSSLPTTAAQNNTVSCYGVACSGDGVYAMAVHGSAPYLEFFKRTGDTFAKLANPLTMPPDVKALANNAVCSADGVYWAFCTNTQARYSIYKRTGDTFALLTNAQIASNGVIAGIGMSADGNWLCFGQTSGSPLSAMFKRVGDTFTQVALSFNITGGPTALSADGTYMVMGEGVGASYRVSLYKRTGDVFTQLFTVGDVQVITAISISSDGRYIATSAGAGGATSVYEKINDNSLVKITSFPLFSNGSNNQGLGFNNNFTTANNFLAYFGNGSSNLRLFRDGYPFNPLTEFQVPLITSVVNGVTTGNTSTNSKPPQVYAYVKIKEPA